MLLLFLFSALSIFGGYQEIVHNSLDRISEPFAFNVVSWEAKALLSEAVQQLSWAVQSKTINEAQEKDLVRRYEGLRLDVASLRRQTALLPTTDDAAEERNSLSQELSQKLKERESIRGRVETLIGDRAARALRSEGILSCISNDSGLCSLFPPVTFQLTTPPSVFIVSPRDRVSLIRLDVLGPGMSPSEIESVESKAEELGWSALVEPTGGYSTYPTIIPEDAALDFIVSTVVHEWMHGYLFFRPLGHNYFNSVEMRTINETVADLIGVEIGRKILNTYRSDEAPNPNRQENGGSSSWAAVDFNFRTEMRETRLNVDRLLAEGKINEAELYMEQQRRFLAQHGYYIRKLNQAYFAFHGVYADSPGSVSPIGGYLQKLREDSASLKDFVRKLEHVSNYQELLELVGAD